MVARAWTDPAYRALMLADGTAAAEALGIPMRGMPPLGVLENTPDAAQPRRLHAVQLLSARGAGLSAVLVQVGRLSGARRARPARADRANGARCCPRHVQVQVVDSTADYRWMVLPMRPAGTEGWSEEKLAAIVREGDMIGVTVPSAG